MQNFSMNSSLDQSKVPSIQQQQQHQLLQHIHSQQLNSINEPSSSSAIDYSLNRQNSGVSPSLTQQQQQQQQQQQSQYQYQQKKLNYKSKLIAQHSRSSDKCDNISNDVNFSKNYKNHNEEMNCEDDYEESNDPNHNLDSSFSNYSYANEPPDMVSSKHVKSKSKSISNSKTNITHQIKQEKEEDLNQQLTLQTNNSKKRRESYLNENNHNNEENIDDDHMSELNDDEDDDSHTMNDSKEKRQKSDLNCVVCDSPANGYNFDAVTCESCKAFFRRNAFRPINLFRCSNNDSCVITVATRKKCKKCRIAKCFRLGMRRDWIMTEVEREEKRKKIEENRRRKQTTPPVHQNIHNGQIDQDMMASMAGSNCSAGQYDEGQYDNNSSLPVRRRRRRRRNSWFDLNNKKAPTSSSQPTTNQVSPVESITNQQQQQSNSINNKNNTTQHDNLATGAKLPINTSQNKQNSPLSSSLSSTSSTSSSSSFTNNNSTNRIRYPSTANLADSLITQPIHSQAFLNSLQNNLQQHQLASTSTSSSMTNSILPLNLMNKQSLDSAQSSLLATKLSSINQYVLENNSLSSPSTPFVLSPTVQQQLQLTFEQQQRQLLFASSFKPPILDFNSTGSPQGGTSQDSLFKQHYAAIAAAAAAQSPTQQNSPYQATLQPDEPVASPLLNSMSISDRYADPRRRRKLKEPLQCDDPSNKPITSDEPADLKSQEQQLQQQPSVPVNTLIPSLKYLSKNNLNHLNEIKLYANGTSYLSEQHLNSNEMVRSPRVLSPVSSTSSSSSSSSSSCEQLNYLSNTKQNDAQNTIIKMGDLQLKQIEAIQQAYKQAIQLVKAQGLPKNSQDINTTINLTELAVRRVIFYFKLISDFRELKHDLMVVLLKFNMMGLLQIHGINSYNKEENTFKEPDTDDTPFSAQSIESVYGTSVYELSISITRNLFDLCAGDMTHIKILMLIVLFDPYNDKLSDSEKTTVAKLQNKYVSLLHAYLCDLMGSPQAEQTFKAILIEISKINDLGKWFEKTVAEKSSCDFVRPLMKEVFGIATPANSAASTPIASSQPSSVGSSCASIKSVSKLPHIECPQNESNFETHTTCSTSMSENSFFTNVNSNLKLISSSSPNNNSKS